MTSTTDRVRIRAINSDPDPLHRFLDEFCFVMTILAAGGAEVERAAAEAC